MKNYTFDGNGQSSNRRVMTEGPNGLCIGITLTIELTTCNHPSSLSAMACNFNMAGGGSCSHWMYIKKINRSNNRFTVIH